MRIALLLLPAVALCLPPPPAAAQIKGVSLVQNLAYPTVLCAPPGDTERLFIVGQQGAVRILKNGALLPRPFLDITPEVLFPGGEQGFLGLAFHPDYATNGWFYVNFITGTGAGTSVIRRYTVSSDPDSADVASGQNVLLLPQPQTNHNGGHLLFDADGYLWTGFGDGGTGGWRSQDPLQLLGKMLRIDVDGDDFPADPNRNYAIPPDNPFVGDPGTLDEIWARGMRNPWRFSFDRLTGDLWIGDVGHNTWEEINFEPASHPGGRNYGWDLMEGPDCFLPPTGCNDGSLTLPVHSWMHGTGCNSASGGYVYRGTQIPSLYGHYFYSDYCSAGIWSFRYEGGTVTEFTDWTATLSVGPGGLILFPASFWEDDAGELYVVEYRAALGEIWKIVPDPAFVGVEPLPAEVGGLLLGAPRPSPFRGATVFDVQAVPGAELDVAVFDAAGRRVRQLKSGVTSAARLQLGWDGKDAAGQLVAAGTYFVRARSGERMETRRVVRLR